jgi:hypothetical protein
MIENRDIESLKIHLKDSDIIIFDFEESSLDEIEFAIKILKYL